MKTKEKQYNKKGFTLIEVMVSSFLFVVVITLALGAFLTINRSRLMTSTMKETQQRIRIANEMIARFSKEAEYAVVLKDDGVNKTVSTERGDTIDLFFELGTTSQTGKRFRIEGDDLNYYECASVDVLVNIPSTTTAVTCKNNNWIQKENLLRVDGSQYNVSIDDFPTSWFAKNSGIPSTLNINISLKNTLPDNSSFDDSMQIQNTFILGGLK